MYLIGELVGELISEPADVVPELLRRDYLPVSAFVRTDATKYTLFLEFFDVSIDITPFNTNGISHFLSCYLGISFD